MQGLQFVLVRQGGLGVSISRGSGFTVQRLGRNADGAQQWSAPCFCTIQNVGVGFTVGMHTHCVTLLCIDFCALQCSINKLVPSMAACHA